MFQCLELHINDRRILGAVGDFYYKLIPRLSAHTEVLVSLTDERKQLASEPIQLFGDTFDLFYGKAWGVGL